MGAGQRGDIICELGASLLDLDEEDLFFLIEVVQHLVERKLQIVAGRLEHFLATRLIELSARDLLEGLTDILEEPEEMIVLVVNHFDQVG